MIERIATLILIVLVVILAATDATAQQTVYKWVDEEGVVHFGEAPPEGVDADLVRMDQTPPAPPPVSVPSASPAVITAVPKAEPEKEKSDLPAVLPAPVAELSLAELDRRCDAAREAKIAPLREAEIERCKAQPRSDAAFCETHNADFGDGGRTMSGAIRPRMFDDLPECVEALQERNSRTKRH